MKKTTTIFITTLFFLLIYWQSTAFLPYTSYDYVIAKVDEIEKTSKEFNEDIKDYYEFSLDNFIYQKILEKKEDSIEDILRNIFTYLLDEIFYNEWILQDRKALLWNNISYLDLSDIKPWDIVHMSTNIDDKGNHVNCMSKIYCKDWMIYKWKNLFPLRNVCIGKKTEIQLEYLNEKIGCKNLDSFFKKDKTLQDLEWYSIKKYYIIIWVVRYFIPFVLFLLIAVFGYRFFLNKNKSTNS